MWFERWLFPPYTLFSGIQCDMCWNHVLYLYVLKKVWVLLSILFYYLLLYINWFLFSIPEFVSSFEFNCGCWLLLWVSNSFRLSGKSFPKVGRNLSHSKCIGSRWMLYLLLIYIALDLTWVINSSCTLPMFTGSAKLLLPMQLLSTILILPKCSASASHFQNDCYWLKEENRLDKC